MQSTPWSVTSKEDDDKRNDKLPYLTVRRNVISSEAEHKKGFHRESNIQFQRSSKSDLRSVVAGRHRKGQNTFNKTRRHNGH